MTTIEKKIDIPENHRVTLDLTLPAELPVGEAEIKVIIIPSARKIGDRKAFAGLAGSLANTGDFVGDPMEIQRKMRDEW